MTIFVLSFIVLIYLGFIWNKVRGYQKKKRRRGGDGKGGGEKERFLRG